GSKNAVGRAEEPTPVLGIVEVALVQDQIGSFGLDELEDPSEISAVSAVADEADPQARVRGNRSGRSLCVPVRGSQGEGQEGRQNSADDETVSTHSAGPRSGRGGPPSCPGSTRSIRQPQPDS